MHGLKPLIWVVWLGIVMIGVEVRHLHAKILDQPAAAAPLIFCLVAVMLVPPCLIRTSGYSRRILLLIFALGALLGLAGVYFHTKFQIEPFVQLLTAEPVKGPQPLVPLSLTGLSTLGGLAVRLLPQEARESATAKLRAQALDR